LSSVPEWIVKGGFEAGNLELSLEIKGRDRDWHSWKTTGWLALSNGLMVTKGTDGPIHDLYVRLLLTRDTAELKRLSFRLADSDLTMEGTVRNWATRPVMTAKLESNQMDIDLLIPKGQRAPIRDLLEWLAATSKVSATASIARGRYKHLKFGAMSARMTIQDSRPTGILPVASWCNSRAGSRRRLRSRYAQPDCWSKICIDWPAPKAVALPARRG
jgi:hypothetical protein